MTNQRVRAEAQLLITLVTIAILINVANDTVIDLGDLDRRMECSSQSGCKSHKSCMRLLSLQADPVKVSYFEFQKLSGQSAK